MPEIKLIALDLDGTLLDSDKVISKPNLEALNDAASRGVWIVPATGRLATALPSAVDELPYVRYVIASNGAAIVDRKTGQTLSRAEIGWKRALDIMEVLDGLPVIYDCYAAGGAFMTAENKLKIPEFAPDRHYLEMWQKLRQPVPDLKNWIRERGQDVQKVQCLFKDMELRLVWLKKFPEMFPDLTVTSSVVNNIEFSHSDANKGAALLTLASLLNIPREQTMAFGDDLNDLPMIRKAGIGVAMKNASDTVRLAADYVTDSCDESGVATAVRKFMHPCFEE